MPTVASIPITPSLISRICAGAGEIPQGDLYRGIYSNAVYRILSFASVTAADCEVMEVGESEYSVGDRLQIPVRSLVPFTPTVPIPINALKKYKKE